MLCYSNEVSIVKLYDESVIALYGKPCGLSLLNMDYNEVYLTNF